MRPLNFINHWLGRIEGFLLGFFLISMTLLAFSQVVARNLFSTGLLWADAFVRLLLLWVGFLGATLATQLGQHLSMDVLTKFIGDRTQKAIGILVKLFAGTVCIYLLRASIDFIQLEKGAGSEFYNSIPNWSIELIIPITFTLMPFHFFVAVLNDINVLLGREVRK